MNSFNSHSLVDESPERPSTLKIAKRFKRAGVQWRFARPQVCPSRVHRGGTELRWASCPTSLTNPTLWPFRLGQGETSVCQRISYSDFPFPFLPLPLPPPFLSLLLALSMSFCISGSECNSDQFFHLSSTQVRLMVSPTMHVVRTVSLSTLKLICSVSMK